MQNLDHKKWMQEALDLAEQAAKEDEVPIGAVVILEGKIIGRGYNQREQNQDPIGHAELMALRQASKTVGNWRLINAELYVTLEPCPMCLAACQQARIQKVTYGTPDLKGGALSLGYRLHEDARTHHRFDAECVPDARCEALLKDFFKKKRLKTS